MREKRFIAVIGGSYGTLAEIAHALQSGIPVIGLSTWSLSRNRRQDSSIVPARNAIDAVERALGLAIK